MAELSKNDRILTFIETTYSQYRGFLLRIIRRYLGTKDSCEDVFHEVFIKIIKNAEYLSSLPKQKFETYIALAARGTAIDYLRKTHKEIPLDTSNDFLLAVLGKKTVRPNTISNSYLKTDLSLLIAKTSTEEQLLLIGKYYLGLTTEDLASIVNGTIPSTKNKLHRARKRLLEEWMRSNLNLGDFLDE